MPSAIPKRTQPLRAEKSFEDEKYFSESDDSSDEEDDDNNNNETPHPDDDDEEDSIDSDGDVSMSDVASDDAPSALNTAQASLRAIDFGTLASAQSSLDRDRRRSQNPRHASTTGANTTTRTDADKVNTLRARLSELKALKSAPGATTSSTSSTSHDPTRSTTSSRARSSLSGANTITPGDHSRSRDGDRAPSRSSKHAPMEQSSKHQVTRRRAVTDISSNPTHARDPRFSTGYASSLSAPDPASTALAHNYAFLADYRQTEVNVLKAEMKALKAKAAKRKSRALLPEEEVAVSRLRVAINRHDNRVKSEKDKERAAEVVRRHRREEREKVEGGKKPYYLKESEVKKRMLTEKFEGMKGRERDRAVKRRQKKISERERRSMPGERRGER